MYEPICVNEHRPNQILAAHTPTLFDSAVQQAAAALRQGEVVALPTETVYGLAANALDAAAVRRIFEIKGRPAHNPIIVHVASLEMARACTRHWPKLADKLAAAFWPGPLTLVLGRADQIPDIVTAGGPTVGVRWPSHPVIQAVIRACGLPLAAPSANPSNQLSPTSAEHVRDFLGNQVRLIVDGGQCQVGIESTVLDLASAAPAVLRPGMITEASLEAVIGKLGAKGHPGTLRSPGQLRRHYSPRAKLLVRHWRDEHELMAQIRALDAEPGAAHIIAHSVIPHLSGFGGVSVIPHDPEAFARALYAELHRCDRAHAKLIVVEAPPDQPEWKAITDRLHRASAEA